MELVVHPKSHQTLTTTLDHLPGALLLTGERGVGLGTIAKYIAGKNLAALVEPTDNKTQANHSIGTITVETIRELYEKTRAKQTTRRVIIIDDADRMSLGAQAAFLKLLEEPTPNTHFILTSHSPQRILPTVRSRTQAVYIEPATHEQTTAFLDKIPDIDTKIRVQLEYLAAGLPAELSRLIGDETYFKDRAATMADTRIFLTDSLYQKLLVVHKYYQNKPATLQLLDSALAVTRRSLSVKPQPALVSQLDRLLIVREKIEANHNIRLQLMAFVLQY